MSDIKYSLTPISEEEEEDDRVTECSDSNTIIVCKEKLRYVIDREVEDSYWAGFADGALVMLGVATLAWLFQARITG